MSPNSGRILASSTPPTCGFASGRGIRTGGCGTLPPGPSSCCSPAARRQRSQSSAPKRVHRSGRSCSSAISGLAPEPRGDQCTVTQTNLDRARDHWTATRNKSPTASGWKSIDRRVTCSTLADSPSMVHGCPDQANYQAMCGEPDFSTGRDQTLCGDHDAGAVFRPAERTLVDRNLPKSQAARTTPDPIGGGLLSGGPSPPVVV
jgi:hypothetical protein